MADWFGNERMQTTVPSTNVITKPWVFLPTGLLCRF